MCSRVLVLSVVVFVRASEYTEKPQWPEMYSVRGIKMNLKADIVQEFRFWRTEHSSRMDYNNGVTKVFYDDSDASPPYGDKYKILPRTTPDGTNEIICQWFPGTKNATTTPMNLLPDMEDYEYVGVERMLGKQATKFFYQNTEDLLETRKTLWAFYDKAAAIWIPLRKEEIAFNIAHGYLVKHTIWVYYDLETDFNDLLLYVTHYVEDCAKEESDTTATKPAKFLDPDRDDHVHHAFDSFKRQFQRKYEEHENEHKIKKDIFKRNMRLVISTNRQNLGYKLALNKLADNTPEELSKRKGLTKRSNKDFGMTFPYSKSKVKKMAAKLPVTFDLRLLGITTPVKEQVNCGSCWAMAPTSAVEGALARHNGGHLWSLSDQAIIDCAWEFGGNGCEGGSDIKAFKWIKKYGLPTVQEYGVYADVEGYCKIKNMTKLYRIKNFVDVTPYSTDAVKVALVNHGPLSVSVHANTAFTAYSSGIFSDEKCNATGVDHEVTLVGYSEEDGEEFWIVKNSWGTDWGIDGYIHISMKNGGCGVTTEPTYVIF